MLLFNVARAFLFVRSKKDEKKKKAYAVANDEMFEEHIIKATSSNYENSSNCKCFGTHVLGNPFDKASILEFCE